MSCQTTHRKHTATAHIPWLTPSRPLFLSPYFSPSALCSQFSPAFSTITTTTQYNQMLLEQHFVLCQDREERGAEQSLPSSCLCPVINTGSRSINQTLMLSQAQWVSPHPDCLISTHSRATNHTMISPSAPGLLPCVKCSVGKSSYYLFIYLMVKKRHVFLSPEYSS